MRTFILTILILCCANMGYSQDNGLIFRYDSISRGIITVGGEKTMEYRVFRTSDRAMIKKGLLTTPFIPLPKQDFPPGEYGIMFQGENRYVNRTFVIK